MGAGRCVHCLLARPNLMVVKLLGVGCHLWHFILEFLLLEIGLIGFMIVLTLLRRLRVDDVDQVVVLHRRVLVVGAILHAPIGGTALRHLLELAALEILLSKLALEV